MAVIHDWIEHQERGTPITDVLDGRILANIMPDLLVDISLKHLAKILPPLLNDLPIEVKNLFQEDGLLKKLDARFIKSLIKSLPHELPDGLNRSDLSDLLSQKSLQDMSLENGNITDRAYLLAYLIPALLDQMEDTHLERASVEIAKRLAPKNYHAVADAHYFDLQLTSREHGMTLENNGRTLIFRARSEGSQPSLAKYRGKIWHWIIPIFTWSVMAKNGNMLSMNPKNKKKRWTNSCRKIPIRKSWMKYTQFTSVFRRNMKT